MPYKFANRYRKKSTRKKSRRQPYGPAIGRKPKMTRALRVHQNLTRDCRWFKTATTISSNSTGDFNIRYRPALVWQSLDFENWGRCWEEFKILKVNISFIPASIGSESLQGVAGQPLYRRGEVIIYFDQGEDDTPTNSFLELITKPSAKLVSARRITKRWMTRPSGNPEWGTFDTATGLIDVPDSWTNSSMVIQGQGFTPVTAPGVQVWYYVTTSYKVLFRGRQKVIHTTTSTA